MKETTKYYFVVYTAASKQESSNYIIGNIATKSTGVFLNMIEITDFIKKNNTSLIGVVITNIIKLTKEEYETWLA